MANFMDFDFDTGGVTLRPRPETELLVEKAVELLSSARGFRHEYRIMDVGTGSGNIAISLTKYLPFCRIVALDISESALRVASANAEKYGVSRRIKFKKSNLFDGAEEAEEGFDLIISNPPYVSLADFASLPDSVKDEPYAALYGGSDGMDFYRRIIRGAPGFLKENGFLLLEVGYDQAEAVKDIIEKAKAFDEIEIFKDYSGIDRVVSATFGGSLKLIATWRSL